MSEELDRYLEDDIGMYGNVSINTIECKHILKGYGAVSCGCNDFPDKCDMCKNNKVGSLKTNLSVPEIKSYFKPR